MLLSLLFRFTFPRNMAQIVRRYRSTSVWKIFFDVLCIFGVMIKFFSGKRVFFAMYSVILLNITLDI